ncbi:MAG: MBL fold metallo-hydrolase [Clostridia bacterium]|nr:MBL fold metallo-hydrolase [Clostridia bacterium]
MEVLFLGADAWRPEGVESDTVSLLIGGKIMMDTGWHPVHNLLREGRRPEDVSALLLTHLHQDHRIGLPQMLFWLLNTFHDASSLEILGVDGVVKMADTALEFAGKNEFYRDCPGPEVRTIGAGQVFERSGIRIETARSHHAVDGLMYAFTGDDGRRIVCSGDTAPNRDTICFAKGADILIHECSFGAAVPEGSDNACGHSGAVEAAQIARLSGVGLLVLVHCDPALSEAALKAAGAVFPHTIRAESGMKL